MCGGAAWRRRACAALLLLALLQLAVRAASNGRGPGSSLAAKRSKRVIVVLGTAGSGTRTIHQILAASGVWMHPYTNKEFDSKLFITKIKHTPPFGMPGKRNGLVWETRHAPAYYDPQQLSPGVREKLAAAHERVAAEMLHDVPDGVSVWGWKEPQAIYTLPFLVKAFPNLHIIHQTRDGRDVALSNVNSTSRRMAQPYQRHYVKTITGTQFNNSELSSPRFSQAAGQTWAAVNVNARRWALEHGLGLQGRYSLTRLEDFCDRAKLHETIGAMLGNAGVRHDELSVQHAAAAIEFTKCQTARWEAAWRSKNTELAAAIRAIDANISGALEAFNYRPEAPLQLLHWPSDASDVQQLRRAGRSAAATGRVPAVLVFIGSAADAALLGNWLAWLGHSRVPLSRVVIATTGSASSAWVRGVQRAARAKGPRVVQLAGTADAAGLDAARLGLQQQVRCLRELLDAGVPVILAELSTLWLQDITTHLDAAARQHGPFDVAVSHGHWPLEALREAAAAPAGAADVLRAMRRAAPAGGGWWFANATEPGRAFVRGLLRELQQPAAAASGPATLSDALRHQLLLANLAWRGGGEASAAGVVGRQATTAPAPLRALAVPRAREPACGSQAARAEAGAALVLDCRGADRAALERAGLWRAPGRLLPVTRRLLRRLLA